MIPYIVFVGSQSTGKSTTVSHLIPHLAKVYDHPVYYIAEIARKIKKDFGVLINKEGTAGTQRMIEEGYATEEALHPDEPKIADRTIIDRYAYTLTSNAAEDKELVKWYKDSIKEICKKYSHIFYIPISDDVPLSLDGVRSSDESFRREVDRIMSETIKEYNIPVYILKGTVDERVNQVLKVLQND